MARDIRDDTALTADPERPGRFHAHLPEAWKVVYIFGGVSMYAVMTAVPAEGQTLRNGYPGRYGEPGHLAWRRLEFPVGRKGCRLSTKFRSTRTPRTIVTPLPCP